MGKKRGVNDTMRYIGLVLYQDEHGTKQERTFHGETAHEVVLLIENKAKGGSILKMQITKVGERCLER